jgi:DNA uptake protein ComE-like DNA-binding protein
MKTSLAAAALLWGALTASAALAQGTTQTAPGSAAPASGAPAASTAAPAPAQGALIDINSASRDELQTLKGIGTARADAIVKGRPYKGKDELHRKNIIPQGVYDDIKDRIVARQS